MPRSLGVKSLLSGELPAGRMLYLHFPPLSRLTMDGHLVASAGLAHLIAHDTLKLG